MDSGVHMHLAVTKLQGSLRDAESGRRIVRRSGPTSAMGLRRDRVDHGTRSTSGPGCGRVRSEMPTNRSGASASLRRWLRGFSLASAAGAGRLVDAILERRSAAVADR